MSEQSLSRKMDEVELTWLRQVAELDKRVLAIERRIVIIELQQKENENGND